MNKQDENTLTEQWHSDTNYLNEKIDDFFKSAQDQAYALGLKRGMAEKLAAIELTDPDCYSIWADACQACDATNEHVRLRNATKIVRAIVKAYEAHKAASKGGAA